MWMKGLGQRYVQPVNCTYRRTGTLFEGRFRWSVIEADSRAWYDSDDGQPGRIASADPILHD